jgi:DNA processing protein
MPPVNVTQGQVLNPSSLLLAAINFPGCRSVPQGGKHFQLAARPRGPECRRPNLRQNHVSSTSSIHFVAPNTMARGALRKHSGPEFLPLKPLESADFGTGNARDTALKAQSPTPVTVDEPLRSCQLSPAATATVLLELELARLLERHPGN